MRRIPDKLKENLSKDPYYNKCCITGSVKDIEWHHNLIFAGKQVNEKFCILPLNREIHKNIVRYKEVCNWIMWNRATKEQIKMYSKCINYERELNRLNKKYGSYRISYPF